MTSRDEGAGTERGDVPTTFWLSDVSGGDTGRSRRIPVTSGGVETRCRSSLFLTLDQTGRRRSRPRQGAVRGGRLAGKGQVPSPAWGLRLGCRVSPAAKTHRCTKERAGRLLENHWNRPSPRAGYKGEPFERIPKELLGCVSVERVHTAARAAWGWRGWGLPAGKRRPRVSSAVRGARCVTCEPVPVWQGLPGGGAGKSVQRGDAFTEVGTAAGVTRGWFRLTSTGSAGSGRLWGAILEETEVTARTAGSFLRPPHSRAWGCPGLCISDHLSRCPTFGATVFSHRPPVVCPPRRRETPGSQRWSVCSAAPRTPGSPLSCEPTGLTWGLFTSGTVATQPRPRHLQR